MHLQQNIVYTSSTIYEICGTTIYRIRLDNGIVHEYAFHFIALIETDIQNLCTLM